jgi:DNA processing protein
MLMLRDRDIPKLLREIPDSPSVLYLDGADINELLEKPRLAVVGTRNASPYGRSVTETIVEDLANQGVVIISGLALGIDSIAHKTALKAGGLTVAVLPGGIKKIYPRTHESLSNQILDKGGMLMSEKPSIESPRAYDFLHRNRLISGLSDAVLVTEAAARSGSLNTARHALEQGKTIFAVPGNINNLYSEGTNNLIKMGAHLVTDAKDIYSIMGWEINNNRDETPLNLPENQMVIYKLVKSGVSSGEELLVKSGLKSSDFTEALTMLEIESLIAPLGANNWTVK